MEEIKIFKAYCKKDFNNRNYYLKVGIEYNCKTLIVKIRYENITRHTILVTSDGVNEIFSLERFYEHFYTEQELRKLKLEKLNNA